MLCGEGALRSGGGWMLGAADALKGTPGVELYVAAVSLDVRDLTRLEGKSIVYYLLPYGRGNTRYNPGYEPYWKRVHDEVKPEVVHIHGSEYSHGPAYVRACGPDNVVVSIQGLTSVYSRYYTAGLSLCDILGSSTPRSLISGGILKGQGKFRRRGEYEKELLRSVKHIIGRTCWDKAHARALNPDAEYHFCGEILRDEFYKGDIWQYGKCCAHSIFLSQASYPIKGLHKVLEAAPLIMRVYPDLKIRVAGDDITRSGGALRCLKLSDYGLMVSRLIKKNKLQDAVSFAGNLDAAGMKEEYLRCNVFVSPGSIENSPNSLAEAQVLGVPCVASYVGGVMDMMRGDEENMYRFEEVEMLSAKVCALFAKEDGVETVRMRQVALERHSPEQVKKQRLETYGRVASICTSI